MSKYEFTFLLPDEAEVEPIRTLIQSLEGKITEEQKWGKRQLSYPMKKLYQAFYFTWMLEIAPKQLAELKKKLNFNEKLLRYLLLKVE
ncbi:MAG: 30S ribosomal protein S6 [Patescibacteria group bacterium]